MPISASQCLLRWAAGLLFVAFAGSSGAQFTTNTVNININATTNRIFDADGPLDCSSTTSYRTNTYTFTVSGLGTVADLNLRLSVLHSYVADLDITLTSPSGYQAPRTHEVILFGSGLGGANFQDTYFDEEEATLRIDQGTSPYAGTYKAQYAFDTLNKFQGINPNGTWTLTIIDYVACDDGFVLWPGANPRVLDDLIRFSSAQIGESWGTNALGTQLIFTVTPCPAITGTVSGGGIICAGNSTNLSVNISGGTPPYAVTLDNGGGTHTNSSPLTFAVSPATTTTYSIASAIDANGCVVTPAGSAIVTVNRLPTAGLDQLQTQINAPLAVPAASLLTNDFDPDADSLSVSSVTPASTRGGTVGLTAGTVTYTPPTNFFGTDSFQYTLADSRGCHSSGTVEMTVVNPLGYQLTITSLSNAYQLEFIGVPGQSYFFQSATSVVGPWSNLYNSITAGPSGLIVTNDTNTPFPGTKYYQVAQ